MKITSRYASRVFWRTFSSSDTAHASGLSEGFMDPNQTIDVNENGSSFQLEIKLDGALGVPLVVADRGSQFHDDDGLFFLDGAGFNVALNRAGSPGVPVDGPVEQGTAEPERGHEREHDERDDRNKDPGNVTDIELPSPGAGCFAGGTQIRLANGTSGDIGRLTEGDEVLGWSESERRFLASKVVKVYRHPAEDLLRFEVEGLPVQLFVTKPHRLLTSEGWRPAGALKADAVLLSAGSQGGEPIPRRLTRVESAGSEPVYNLTTEPTHTYVAGEIIAHNVKKH
jgi:hypothetical protein